MNSFTPNTSSKRFRVWQETPCYRFAEVTSRNRRDAIRQIESLADGEFEYVNDDRWSSFDVVQINRKGAD